MPVKRRRAKRRVIVEDGTAKWWDLAYGEDEDKPAFASDAGRREAWESSREVLMAEFCCFGKRPDAFWDYLPDEIEIPADAVNQQDAIYRTPELALPGEAEFIEAEWRGWIDYAAHRGFVWDEQRKTYVNAPACAREIALGQGVPPWFYDRVMKEGEKP